MIGTLSPFALGVARLRKVLSAANVTVAGYRLQDKQIRAAVKELEAAAIVVRDHNGVCATPGWELFLTRAAHQMHSLPAITAGFFDSGPSTYWDQSDAVMLFRIHVVMGDFDALDELTYGEPTTPGSWWFLADPPAVDLLERLPPRYREDALAGCLEYAIEAAAAPDTAIAACLELSGELSRHAADIAFLHVLKGRFEDAAGVFAALPPAQRDSRAAATGLAATQALVALLRGEDSNAGTHLDATIKAEKRGSRKRIVFPDSRAFALTLLSLVRTRTPESMHKLEELLNAAERRNVKRHSELNLVANALAAQREEIVYHTGRMFPCLDLLYDGLALAWRSKAALQESERRDALAEYRDQARAGGYDWVTAECDALLRLAGVTGTVAESPSEDVHARLGTTTLTTLATPAAEWERTLRALEQYAYDTVGNARGKASPTAERRLVWELQDYDEGVKLVPREQRRNKNGKWTKGRKVALKRLAREAHSMLFLRDEDRAAVAAIKVTRGWYGDEQHILGEEGLYALAEHPHVFNPQGETVDIVRRAPELRLDEDAEWVTATVEPHDLHPDDNQEYAHHLNGRRCEVIHFTPARRRLLEIVPPEGIKLPLDARPRLLEAVSALASEIRVHGGIDEDAPGTTQIEADPEPWVRLEPLDDGLRVALAVEPVPDSGLCFEPGAGGISVFTVREGENIRARRDLEAERGALSGLLERCPTLATRPTERQPLLLPTPADCLEFLDQLQEAEARCKWPRGEPLRIVAHASAQSLSLSVKSAAEWLQASGELRVDAQRLLDLQRLFALLEERPGSRFLELAPGEFLALTDTFRRQLDDFASLSGKRGGDATLHPLGALALDDLLEEADVSADEAWREQRARLDAAQTFEPELPSTLQTELRPYQHEGFRWLSRLSRWGAGACLADDMGLGKTVQTLALLVERAPGGPALVAAPTSVVANWTDEARRFAPTLRVRLLVGTASSRARLLEEPVPFDLFLTTYGVLQNDIDALAEIPWHSAVLDEAQAIKNPNAKRARAARRLSADFRLVTTGTPIQNNLMDLHSLFAFANPGLLGATDRFRQQFGLPIERDGDEDARDRLRRVIAPFVLRRLKSEVIKDLPERTEIPLHVEMSAEEAALYETIRQRAVADLDTSTAENTDGQRRIRILAHLTRLRLACCNPRLVLDAAGDSAPPSSKLATFAATLDELLANRHKVLVFSQFVTHLKLVEEYVRSAGIAYQYLDGATPAKNRAERIAAFQAGDGDAFLISLKAGGVGLNLTAADYVIHMDPWWNPAVEDQASDRAHRIGQTRPVTIYRLIAKGTIEEQIVDLHHRKRDLADRLLEGADASARLDPDALLALLRQPLGASN